MRWTPLLSLLVALPAVAQIGPDETDPVKIMQAVEGRPQGDKAVGRLAMTVTDGQGRERKRVVQSWAMEFAGGRKQLMIFESPADERNTGLLSVDYDDGAKDDDQWLYLTSLKKSTRISSGEKSGSFMGTDLSFADMTKADPSHWSYTLVKPSAPSNGEDCWLIEATPKTDRAREETGYVKTMMFVSKRMLLPVRTKAWVAKGKKLKYIDFGAFEQIDGVWTAKTIQARTVKDQTTESTTLLQFTSLKFNQPEVNDGLFNQGRLEKGL
ncbi:MAG: outer membrane lipoprotein-sorting protein [Myxococcales bacterium]|nr:outer membrane lipoprotein-sorting protein [Myxococcales bacterium]